MPAWRRGQIAALLVIAVVLFGGAALRHLWPEPPIRGFAYAVDGDTLRLGGRRVRLLGIDAPELAQTCTNPHGGAWACGEAARALMVDTIGGRQVICQPDGYDRYRRILAHCEVGGTDIQALMGSHGLAVADGGYGGEQQQAAADKRGIWDGSFMLPSLWRRTHQEADLGASRPDRASGMWR